MQRAERSAPLPAAARRNRIHHSAHQVPYRANCVFWEAGDVLPICRIPDLIAARERHQPPTWNGERGALIGPAPRSHIGLDCVTGRRTPTRNVSRRPDLSRSMQSELHSGS